MNKTLWQYYTDLAASIDAHALQDVQSLDQWRAERADRREEFFRSVGLWPLPGDGDLKVTAHGGLAGPGFTARKLSYQLLPQCWSSGNLYLPAPLPAHRVPGILYVCGHAGSGISGLHPHAIAWARRGYACFIFNTIKQDENPGRHHGLFGNRLDWISRGYLASGGELLNSLRALDVLAAAPEVDPARLGATGCSGGGAHSLFVGIADDRLRAVASVAGISSVAAAIGERTLQGHCDCMYPLGLFQRDVSEFAALLAPRPLLLCFAADDALFTPTEYPNLHRRVQSVYGLHACPEHCELFVFPGPHGYSAAAIERIQTWMDQHVAGEPHPAVPVADPELPEPTVAVFNGAPPVPDHLDLLPELLSPRGGRPLPAGPADWEATRAATVERLRRHVFGWLDAADEEFGATCLGSWIEGDGQRRYRYRATLGGMELFAEAWLPEPPGSGDVLVAVGDFGSSVDQLQAETREGLDGRGLIAIEQRATGVNAAVMAAGGNALWRAAALTGVTPALLWMNDLRQLLAWLRTRPELAGRGWYLYGQGEAAATCLYHAVFDPTIKGVALADAPDTHAAGGYIPGILRELDITDASGLLAPRPFGVATRGLTRWLNMLHWGIRVYERLGVRDRYLFGTSTVTVLRHVLNADGSPARRPR